VEVLRLWVCANDKQKDQPEFVELLNHDLNQKQKEINLIRKIYW